MERTSCCKMWNDSDLQNLIQDITDEGLKEALEFIEEFEKAYKNGLLKGGPGGPDSPGVINVINLLKYKSSTVPIGADRDPAQIKKWLLDERSKRQSNQKRQIKL